MLNAPFEPDGWGRAVGAIAAATRSAGAQLIAVGGPLALPLNVVTGDFSGPWAHFADPRLYGRCNWRINSVGAQGSIQHEQHYAAYAARNDTADYDDAVADLDVPYGCQSALRIDADRLIGLSLLRRTRDGACDADTLATFENLRDHTARAVAMQLAIDGEAADMMLGSIATMRCATFLLDRHGNIAAMSAAADPLFDSGGPFLPGGITPRLRCPDEDRRLSLAMGRLLGDADAISPLQHIRVGRGLDWPDGRWNLYLSRLPAREHGLGFEPHLAITVKPVAVGDARVHTFVE